MIKLQRNLAMTFIAFAFTTAQAVHCEAGSMHATYHVADVHTKGHDGIEMSHSYNHDEQLSPAIGEAELHGYVAAEYLKRVNVIAVEHGFGGVANNHTRRLIKTHHHYDELAYNIYGGHDNAPNKAV